MDKFPLEILRNIGGLVGLSDLKACSSVCKSWKKPFQTLIYKEAIFLTENQLQLYLKQEPSLKVLTTSFQFDILTSDEVIESLVQTCPFVDSLRACDDGTEHLTLSKNNAPLFRHHWFNNLVKIEFDSTMLGKAISLLCHQLQEVKGGFDSLFDKQKNLIPMPQLKKLDISQEDHGMSAKRLDAIRVAYPKLEALKLAFFRFEPVDDTFVYTPFPYVRTLEIFLSYDRGNYFDHQIKKMFTDLKHFSHEFGSCPPEVASDPNVHCEFFTEHPNIYHLDIDYLTKMAQNDGFPALKKLSKLNWLNLQINKKKDIITQRELLDFDLLMSSAPKLKRLMLNGLFHINTGESLDNYLSGTVGFYDKSSSVSYVKDQQSVISTNVFSNEVENLPYYKRTFGNGEDLCKGKTRIMIVKKKLPYLELHEEGIPIYAWSEEIPNYDRIFNNGLLKETISAYPLTKLILREVTLRNPTYKWIAQHLPLLEELYVNLTEPYPFCNIVLGNKLYAFRITFDERYKKYGAPLVCLNNHHLQRERTVAWRSEKEAFETVRGLDDIGLPSAYAISITYRSTFNYFQVCDHSMLDVLKNMTD